MRITFTKDDPRRGMTAEVDATVARRHIDSGSAREATAAEIKAADAALSVDPATPTAPPIREPATTVRPAGDKATPAKKATKTGKKA